MQLKPKEAIVLFIRRGETEPARYMVGIRKAETGFDPRHDLQVGIHQEAISVGGEFDDLTQAINTACEKLQGLGGKAAARWPAR